MTEDRNPRACFNLTIVDDDIRELAEMLNVTLLDSDLEHLDEVLGFTIGLSHTIVTIQPDGNDSKYINSECLCCEFDFSPSCCVFLAY